jgi:hypothetical protein
MEDGVAAAGGGGATEVDGARVGVFVAVADVGRDGRGCGRDAVIVRPLGVGTMCELDSDEGGGVDGGAGRDVTRVGGATAEAALVLPDDDEHAVSASVIATITAADRDQRVISCRCVGRSSTAGSEDGASVRRAVGATSSSTPSRR